MPEHEPLNIFGEIGAVVADQHEVIALHHPEARPPHRPREEFLTGLLASWAAHDREPGAKPTKEEQRRAGEGARAALGEIRR